MDCINADSIIYKRYFAPPPDPETHRRNNRHKLTQFGTNKNRPIHLYEPIEIFYQIEGSANKLSINDLTIGYINLWPASFG